MSGVGVIVLQPHHATASWRYSFTVNLSWFSGVQIPGSWVRCLFFYLLLLLIIIVITVLFLPVVCLQPLGVFLMTYYYYFKNTGDAVCSVDGDADGTAS